jgi:CubicO group peptidase (beta-lactamase class C family)
MDTTKLTAMHDRLQWYVDKNILPHAFSLIMKGTDIVDYRCFGYMDTESKTPLREDAIYRIFSNTKIVTSVAALMLVEQKRLDLDAPISKLLPAFATPQVLIRGATSIGQVEPAITPITLRHLMSHSAGFSYGFVDPESLIDSSYLSNGLDIITGYDGTLEGLCDKLASFPLAFQPGSSWRYSLATDVVARLIEVASGTSFDVFLQKHIFEPLEMHDTGFSVSAEKLERIPAMYMPNDPLDPMASGITLMSPAGAQDYLTPPECLSGGGGLLSSVADYVRFLQMLINRGECNGVKLLEPHTVAQMHQNQLAPNVDVYFPMWNLPSTKFGLGFAVKDAPEVGEPETAIGEYHWGGLAGTHSWISPETGITGFCGTQVMPAFWHPFSHDFKRMIYGAC